MAVVQRLPRALVVVAGLPGMGDRPNATAQKGMSRIPVGCSRIGKTLEADRYGDAAGDRVLRQVAFSIAAVGFRLGPRSTHPAQRWRWDDPIRLPSRRWRSQPISRHAPPPDLHRPRPSRSTCLHRPPCLAIGGEALPQSWLADASAADSITRISGRIQRRCWATAEPTRQLTVRQDGERSANPPGAPGPRCRKSPNWYNKSPRA